MRLIFALFFAVCAHAADTVVFWQEGFPSIETQPIERTALEAALPSAAFENLEQLSLGASSLLVLPYGSAVPVAAWPRIQAFLDAGGNLLVLGGRPLYVPVSRSQGKFIPGTPENTYSRRIGIPYAWEVPRKDFVRFGWARELTGLPDVHVRARRAFAGAEEGIGYLLDSGGEYAAAVVAKGDRIDPYARGGRDVFLMFDPEPGYWSSEDGLKLIRWAAQYALAGVRWVRVEMQNATIAEGEVPQALVQVRNVRGAGLPGSVRVELSSGGTILDSIVLTGSEKGDTVAAPVVFNRKLAPGFYSVRAIYREGATAESHITGFWIRDLNLLASSAPLGVSGDYFTRAGTPFLPLGVNYFNTDRYGGWLVGSGSPWAWERDFSDMERKGITFVRTGIWDGSADSTDHVSGGATERFLRTLEAFLHSAARHHIQVQFTLFAFDPQTVRRGATATVPHLGPGSNPYTDPVAVAYEERWVRSLVERFRGVPSLSWDLINEPSFSNPRRIWRTVPNGDATEAAAWNAWLEKHYGSPERLAEAWGAPAEELRFGSIPLPTDSQLEFAREGQLGQVRAVDYNLFAQDAFKEWVSRMVAAIRAAGSRQMIAVGQDEGGVLNRPLNQFYGGAGVDFTVNHSWWQDDALLWDSVAAKRPGLPNLIGETGAQQVWKLDSSWRWDEAGAANLVERKLALGFAARNAGALLWQWARGDEPFGIQRSDGSNKIWMSTLEGLARFASQASPYAAGGEPPEVAIVLPQSLQLSVYNRFAIAAQQRCVRALFHDARAVAYVVGEYQINLLGNPKLIILPSPWLFSQPAWNAILARVRDGATLLISGRIDLDEHYRSHSRAEELGLPYRPGLLDAREHMLSLAGHELPLTYPGEAATYLERGVLEDGSDFSVRPFGRGAVLYFPLPLEMNENLDSLGAVYRFALDRAKVAPLYRTDVRDPGILICPTRLESATLYVLTSESGAPRKVAFTDVASGKQFATTLAPGRAALALIRHDGTIAAAYNF